MRYKAGDKVKIISKERFKKHGPPPGWFSPHMDYLLGTEQIITRTLGNLYIIGGDGSLSFGEEAIEGPVGPMDSDMIKAGQEKKYNTGKVDDTIYRLETVPIGFKAGPGFADAAKEGEKEFWGKELGLISYSQDEYKHALKKFMACEEMNAREMSVVYDRYLTDNKDHFSAGQPPVPMGKYFSISSRKERFKTPFERLIDEEAERNKSSFDSATIKHSPLPFSSVTTKTGTTNLLTGEYKTSLTKYHNHEPMTQEERDMVYYSYRNSVSEPVTYADFYLNYEDIEMVNHPAHYGGADNPYEAVKVIEAWGLDWHLGSAVKYIARAGKKDPKKTKEDLEKALWYLQRKISNIGILLLFCFSGFAQVDPKLKIDTSGKNTADFIYSVTSGEMLYNVNKNRSYEIWDSAGCWLRWKENSDTLQLIPPAKVHYLKIGNKIIRL